MTTIAVTGSEGFIASHLVETLVREGYHVRAMVQYNSFSSFGWLETVATEILDHVDVRLGDVRDHRSVDELAEGADVICHLAALIAIPYSYQAPESYLATNAGGTLNVLEAARRHGTRRVIHTSTSEVYGTAINVPDLRGSPAAGAIPVLGVEDRCRQARRELPPELRPAGHDHPARSTPTDRDSRREPSSPRRSARSPPGKREIRLGSQDPTRDFNFVSDTVAAFLSLVEADDDVLGRTFNCGSGTEISIGELVCLIGEVMGHEVTVAVDPQRIRPEGSEVMRLVCDNSALKAASSWKPQS